jgi:hypothetical protein
VRHDRRRDISGKFLVLATLGVAALLTAFALRHHYRASHRAAQFWGRSDARLLVGAPVVRAFELRDPPAPDGGSGVSSTGEQGPPPDARIGGRAIGASSDLSQAKGLVHLRHAFTQDAHFQWDAQRREPVEVGAWKLALEFADPAAGTRLLVLLTEPADVLGRLDADGRQVDVLPCPLLAEPVGRYLAAERNPPPAAP